jgi:GNAT superfamily N-acetyltransferase
MKLFKHYKNKPYKYIGQAKHSETLEDLVIYETRYENKLGKLWARPKGMFFETIELDGRQTPRFEEIALEIKETTTVTEDNIKTIGALMVKAFGEWDSKWFFKTFDKHKNFHLLMASIETKPVAFKLGYELEEKIFYSWLGGVVPEFRNLGIAADLMTAQHRWCKENGYSKIQTKTQNRFREMLLLNLRFGFDVVGHYLSDDDGPKIILEKMLEPFDG